MIIKVKGKTSIITPFLYTIFNKYGFLKREEMLKYIWDYYIWKTLIYEFGGPYLLLITHTLILFKDIQIAQLLTYGLWLIALLLIYEVDYIVNDFFSYREPMNIRSPRLSNLFPSYDFDEVKRVVLWSIFLRIILTTLIILFYSYYNIRLAYMFIAIALSIFFLFVIHPLTYSLLVRV